jgi:hypothetical protein
MGSAQRLLAGTSTALIVATALVSAQGLPTIPRQAFGGSVTPAYDGWYENQDGTRTYLMGYYSRNTSAEVDIPIGPNNHFEPGEPDRGQPTHFYPNRSFGMFSIKLPANIPASEKLWWVLTANGVTQRVPLNGAAEYTITPSKASEESPGGKYNAPPILRFTEKGAGVQAPVASMATAVPRTATVGQPMPLEMWVEDDGLYSTGSNAPLGREPKMIELKVGKYRGPGEVKVGEGLDKMMTLKGGKPSEPYAAKASTTLTFSEPGDYFVHVTVLDLSGPGGGSAGCCWTTGMLKVAVAGAAGSTAQ